MFCAWAGVSSPVPSPLQAPPPRGSRPGRGRGRGTKKPCTPKACRGGDGPRERRIAGIKKGTPREPSAAGSVGRRRGKGAERHLAERPGGAVRTLPKKGDPTGAQRSGFRGEKEGQGSGATPGRKAGGERCGPLPKKGDPTGAQRSGSRGEKEGQGSGATPGRKAGGSGADFAKKRGPHGSPAQRVPWGEGGARERSDTWPKGRGERCGLCPDVTSA